MLIGLPVINANDTDTIEINIHNEIKFKIHTSACEGLETGGSIWHASIFLSRYLCLNPMVVRGKNVLEIGAGCGLVSLTASILGANVIATDIEEQLDLLNQNIQINKRYIEQSIGFCHCESKVFNFGESVKEQFSIKFDIVIGADIGYDHILHQSIARSLQSFFELDDSNEIEAQVSEKHAILIEEVRWKDIYEWYFDVLADTCDGNCAISDRNIVLCKNEFEVIQSANNIVLQVNRSCCKCNWVQKCRCLFILSSDNHEQLSDTSSSPIAITSSPLRIVLLSAAQIR